MSKRNVVISALAASAAVAGVLVSAAPAQANSAFGCAYPRVCFYKQSTNWDNNNPTAKYQDYGDQPLTAAARGSYYVYNTRNDDRAIITYLKPAGGTATLCVNPNSGRAVGEYGTATRINIQDTTRC